MEDMLSATEDLGNLLRDHRGMDALVMDLRAMGTWTDFFVIATASSDAHLDGLERHVRDFCHDRGMDILRRSHRPKGMIGSDTTDEWRIIDLGPIVIHLMSAKARAFYDLERLYSS